MNTVVKIVTSVLLVLENSQCSLSLVSQMFVLSIVYLPQPVQYIAAQRSMMDVRYVPKGKLNVKLETCVQPGNPCSYINGAVGTLLAAVLQTAIK